MAEAARNTGGSGGPTGDELQRWQAWLAALTWELEQAKAERADLLRELRLLKHDLRLAHADRRRSVKRPSRLRRHAS